MVNKTENMNSQNVSADGCAAAPLRAQREGKNVRLCLAMLGAVLSVMLLDGCASMGGSEEPGQPSPFQYNPTTGYPAIGGPTWGRL